MSKAENKRLNKQGWWIALIFATPMVAALLMALVPGLQPDGGTRNFGQLIDPPKQMQWARIGDSEDATWLRGRWTLLQTVEGHCTDDCRANLDKLARIHQALGRHHHRLQRVLVSASQQSARLSAAWPGLIVLHGDAAAVLGLAAQAAAGTPAGLIIIDPWGYAMMSYDSDYDASGTLKDLQRLLRYAKEEAERRALEEASGDIAGDLPG